MRRRIWSEFLPASELGSTATLALLRRFDLEPIVALPPHNETPEMAAALHRLSSAGLRVGLWPLLVDGDGYWPSEDNAQLFADRVRNSLAFAKRAGARIDTVAIDLEPPLAVTRLLMNGTSRERGGVLLSNMRAIPGRRALRARSIACLHRLRDELDREGYNTIAAAIPAVVLDLFAGGDLWQGVLRTPVSAPGWSVISPMVYTTIIRSMLPSRSIHSARAVLHEAGRMLVRSVGHERASLSLGLVSAGKLGDEPAFFSPDDLAQDVQAARAAGVDDLALFCLEGVLRRGSPEAWLGPFTEATARAPSRVRATSVGLLMRTASLGSTLGSALLR